MCINTIGSYTCQCNTGYYPGIDETACFGKISQSVHFANYIGTVFFLIDINECDEDTDGCAQNCTNTNGSYACSCDTGYHLGNDGYSCYGTSNYPSDLGYSGLIITDIDECSENLDRCAQYCINTNGSYSCACGSCYYLSTNGYSCSGKYPYC